MNPAFFPGYNVDVTVQPVGEYPDISPTTVQAFQALDSLCQELEALKRANAELEDECGLVLNRSAAWQQHSEGLQARINELEAENARLQTERDTARALGSRRGW